MSGASSRGGARSGGSAGSMVLGAPHADLSSARGAGSDPAPISRHREKSVKKPAPPPAPPQAPKTAAPAPEPTKPGDPREARRRERQARTPPRR